MSHCKDCYHWKEKAEEPTYRRCGHPKVDAYHPSPDGCAGGDGGEPYNAGSFATGPEFGCVLFETNPSPTAET